MTLEEYPAFSVYLSSSLSFIENTIGSDTQNRYETVCHYCYRSALHLKKDETLKLCSTCEIAPFCPSCPQSHSESQCALFSELAFDERFLVDYIQHTGENFVIDRTRVPRTRYIPLSSATGCKYFYILAFSCFNESTNLSFRKLTFHLS